MTHRTAILPSLPLRVAIAASLLLAGAVPASAASGPGTSLERCQGTLRTEGVKYLRGTQKAVASCLGRVAREVLARDAGGVGGALAACGAAFHEIGRTDGRSLADKLAAKVTARCAPAPANGHSLADLLGTGPTGAPQPLHVKANLDDLCGRFGGDGSLDDEGEWLACVRAAHDCAAGQAIATAFPRAPEWLSEVATALPPSDARDAALAFAGVLDCAAGESGLPARVLATGQDRCFGGPAAAPVEIPCGGTEQDGESRTGAELAYLDNGDGTITDLVTRLVWEKKSDDGSLHAKDLRFPWAGVCAGDGATSCTSDASCASAGGPCENGDAQTPHPNGLTAFEWVESLNAAGFAGYADWRLPNARELETLVDRDRFSPVVGAPFETDCGPESIGNPGCTVLTCSCTVPGVYWTSTTYVSTPSFAWGVFFNDGVVSGRPKQGSYELVRAVRGGA
jgi:hypothetical protein